MAAELAIAKSWPAAPPDATAAPDIPALVDQKADQYGVRRDLARSIAQVESNFNPNAVSPKGARGVMQLMPATARGLGVTDVHDPEQNVDAGVRLLAQLGDRYNGDPRLIAAAYNAGPGAVDRYNGVPPYRETRNYVTKVAQNLSAPAIGTAARADISQPTDVAQTTTAPTSGIPVSAAQDIFTRLARGEQVDTSPQALMQVAFGQPAAPARPAGPQPEEQPLSIAKSWGPPPPPEPSPLAKGVKAFWESNPLSIISDLATAATSHNPLDMARATQQGLALVKGIVNEPQRWFGEAAQLLTSEDGGTALYHAGGSIPWFGGAINTITQEYQSGKPAEATGHLLSLLSVIAAPEIARGAAPVLEKTIPAVAEAADVAPAVVKAGAERFVQSMKEAPPSPAGKVVGRVVGGAAGKGLGLGGVVGGGYVGGEIGSRVPAVPGAIGEAIEGGKYRLQQLQNPPPELAPGETFGPERFSQPEAAAAARQARQAAQEAGRQPAPPPPDTRPVYGPAPDTRPAYGPQPAPPAPAAPVTPPAPAQPTLSFDDLAASLTGKSPSKLTAAERQSVQTIYDRMTQGLRPEDVAAPPAAAPQPAPSVAPETPPIAAAPVAPTPAPSVEPAAPSVAGPLAGKPQAAQIAADLEQSMRVDRLTDFAKANEIPAAKLRNYNQHELGMLAEAAGTQPPTAADVAAVHQNLADFEAAQQMQTPSNVPAEAEAQFERNKTQGLTHYTETGELKTAAKYGADVKTAKIEAKAQRWAQALSKLGYTAEGVEGLEPGLVPAESLASGATPGWSNVMHDLVAKGLLETSERNPPQSSLPRILEIMREAEAKKPAAPVIPVKPGMNIAEVEQAFQQAKQKATIKPNEPAAQTAGQPAANAPGANVSLPQPRSPGSGTAPGAETTIRVPGEQRAYQARYVVRELDDVQASHNPETFQRNPDYHYRNDREYSNPANQERIVVNSQPGRFDPAYLVNDSPDAVNGAPVIDSSGNVLGGNSRTMMLDRVYRNNPEGAAAYRAELARRAQQFGIDPETVKGMKRPVLVREITNLEADPQHVITDLNKTGTAQLTTAERATADARRMSATAADTIAQAIDAHGPEATLNDVLSSKSGAGVINKLVDDGVFTMQEKPALVDAKSGAVTAAAKERIAKMLLGQVFEDADQMMRTPPEIRNKLERAVSPILQSGQKAGFDIVPTVRQSMDLLEYARAHGITNLGDAVRQESMFGGGPTFSPEAVRLGEFLRDAKPTAIAQAFRRYVANAEPSMFGESSPAEAFADAFGAPEDLPRSAGQLSPAEAEKAFTEAKAKPRTRRRRIVER